MTQVDANFASLHDPADRPWTLSNQQKQRIIENGTSQPKLKRYPECPGIPTKKCRFQVGGFRNIPISSIALKQIQPLVSFAVFFHRALDEKNPLLPGLTVSKDGIK